VHVELIRTLAQMLVLKKTPHSRLRAERMKFVSSHRASGSRTDSSRNLSTGRGKNSQTSASLPRTAPQKQHPAPRRAANREIPSPHFPCVQLLAIRLRAVSSFSGKPRRGAARRIDHVSAEDDHPAGSVSGVAGTGSFSLD
jgi:hypothetical protein